MNIHHYLHDIRNFRKFTPEQIENINNLCSADRLQIIKCYNIMIEWIAMILEDDNKSEECIDIRDLPVPPPISHIQNTKIINNCLNVTPYYV